MEPKPDPVHALACLGGVATMGELAAAAGRRAVRRALDVGTIERAGIRLVLPELEATPAPPPS